jgi:hypothetical protein
MLPEERNDHLQQIPAPSHDVAVEVLFVVVMPGVNEDLADSEEFTNLLQAVETFRSLRDCEFVAHLETGSIPSPSRAIGLSHEPDTEAPFTVYEPYNPAQPDQPFLLVTCTHRIVTYVRAIWPSRR